MNIFDFLNFLWFRYPTRGDRMILDRLDDIQRQLNNLLPRDISPQFKKELLRKIERVDSDVRDIPLKG